MLVKFYASGENIMALTVFGLSALTKGAFGAISGEWTLAFGRQDKKWVNDYIHMFYICDEGGVGGQTNGGCGET